MRPEVVGDRYELVGRIGAGGMGEVHEGFDRHLKRRIAVKFTQPGLDSDPEWSKRFFREAELMARLRHPGMPVIHDAGTVPGNPDRPYLVMEYIEGITFGELLSRRGPLPYGVVANLGAQAAAVLAATHRNRIYHRDLKPSNLMLSADGTVKVVDFGLAVVLDTGMTRYTSTGHTLGTPAFMAPEQVEGRPVVPQTDLYALGLVLHELLTGDRVMTGSTPYAVWQNQVHLPSPDIGEIRPDVPAEMAELIMIMLAKSPDQRPEDAASVHAVLLRHATALDELPEVDDPRGPAFLYAKAVAATVMPPEDDLAPGPVDLPPLAVREAAAAGDFSRGDLKRAVVHARDLADRSRYDPAVHELETVMEIAVPLFGSRDADVVEARLQLADLRFDSGDYAGAADLYRHLVDDLTAERGPYDEQVMLCQRRLASCEAHAGDMGAALARLQNVHRQMAIRYGEQDRRVIELARLIRNTEPA
ncbi:serine/threonine protein kinase [Nocardia farcinica]|uniref:serine/threonine-protein kinase n=1 Tax=Nocardia farcinica TaxID=37329 RepID=UPI0018956C8B|nr:serine/threonine-protein kinase [Nocardia farcinica]MBF6231840.1 serine/threonine protein kinase [Nocardia farcinica]MBF6258689.1 serine/threonine protein kinase [Nocardia farcinica]MBF6420718.1 serine/threonine protein kinase [Nocardia farcinica]MBF6431962.1 serine/threonine protein kinase [Nocardia farcinica]MBF6502672.1 serine/threonine protein kinase [Nocardia farcinica]